MERRHKDQWTQLDHANVLFRKAGLVPIEWKEETLANLQFRVHPILDALRKDTTWRFIYVQNSLVCLRVERIQLSNVIACRVFGPYDPTKLLWWQNAHTSCKREWPETVMVEEDVLSKVVSLQCKLDWNYGFVQQPEKAPSWKITLMKAFARTLSRRCKNFVSHFACDGNIFWCREKWKQDDTQHHGFRISLLHDMAIEVSCHGKYRLIKLLSIVQEQLLQHVLVYPNQVHRMLAQVRAMINGRLRFILSHKQRPTRSIGETCVSFDSSYVWEDPDDILATHLTCPEIRDLVWDYTGYSQLVKERSPLCSDVDCIEVRSHIRIRNFDSRFKMPMPFSQDYLAWEDLPFHDCNAGDKWFIETQIHAIGQSTSLDTFKEWFLAQVLELKCANIARSIEFYHPLWLPRLSMRRPDLSIIWIVIYNIVVDYLMQRNFTVDEHVADHIQHLHRQTLVVSFKTKEPSPFYLATIDSIAQITTELERILNGPLIHRIPEKTVFQAIFPYTRLAKGSEMVALQRLRYGEFDTLMEVIPQLGHHQELAKFAQDWVHGESFQDNIDTYFKRWFE